MKAVIYPDEVERMRHALGIDSWKHDVSEKELSSYRNRYCAVNPSEVCDLWEKLVTEGFAERTTPFVDGMIYYSVTEKGIKAIEEKLGVKINIID